MPRVRPLRSLARQRVLSPPTKPPVPLPTKSQAGRPSRFTEQERKHVLQQKTLGRTYQAIADEMRCAPSTIYWLCKDEFGAPGKPSYVLNANDKLIISRFKEGRSLNSIARDFNQSFGAIWSHFHRYLVPSDPVLSAKIATDPEIDAIVRKGLLKGKTPQQMARENRQSVHVIRRHVWRYQTPAQKRPHQTTPHDRQQILQLMQAGNSAKEVSITQGFTTSMISKIVHQESAKMEIPDEVRRLAAEGENVMQIAHKTNLSRSLVNHFSRRLSQESDPPRGKGERRIATRWTKARRDRLVALWNGGMTPTSIASELKKPVDQVYRALWRWKDDLTRAYNPINKQRWTADEISKVLNWQKSQMPLQEIATLLPGRSIHGIRSLLRRSQE